MYLYGDANFERSDGVIDHGTLYLTYNDDKKNKIIRV